MYKYKLWTFVITLVVNIICFQANAATTPLQYSVDMEAHTLRVVSVATATLRNTNFLTRFPEFREIAGESELGKVIDVLMAHDRAKQDMDILQDLVKFHGVRCGSLAETEKMACLDSIKKLNARDTQYINEALKKGGYMDEGGNLSKKGRLILALEKAGDWGDRYWASVGKKSAEFGDEMEKGSTYVRTKVLANYKGTERDIIEKSVDVLEHLEADSNFDYAAITKGMSGEDISALRQHVGRDKLPVSAFQREVRSQLIVKYGKGFGFQRGLASLSQVGRMRGINRIGKNLGRATTALTVYGISDDVLNQGEHPLNAIVYNLLPGSEVQASDMASYYDRGTSGYASLEKLPLSARQNLMVRSEDILKLRKRYIEEFPVVMRLNCNSSAYHGHHIVEYDFGPRLGIKTFEFWLKDRRYAMYNFLDLPIDDSRRKNFTRSLLLRESQNVELCCKAKFRCPAQVNADADFLYRQPSFISSPTDNLYRDKLVQDNGQF